MAAFILIIVVVGLGIYIIYHFVRTNKFKIAKSKNHLLIKVNVIINQ